MRVQRRLLALATIPEWLLAPGTWAARPCTSGPGSFEHVLRDVRYDGPDPSKGNGLATMAAGLQTSTGTTIFKCVAQWPEGWAGWFEGGSRPVWADCVSTGAPGAPDDVVSFAVDWKTKTIYLAQTFACSDKPGSVGLATGSTTIDVACATSEGSEHCVPRAPEGGVRPTLSIQTKLRQVPSGPASACDEAYGLYHGWLVEGWLREIEMLPGAVPTAPNIIFDTGPSFRLHNVASGDVLRCASASKENSTFVGACEPLDGEGATTAEFRFDTQLNVLEIAQRWMCGRRKTLAIQGAGYMRGSCSPVQGTNRFRCTSLLVWFGTGIV
ncbi:hypothetical protein VTJ83DRAFT_7047 [Remersonia thermophila]|uniref:Uncharacterized protein n=1 Tax=Remersonia thermophila TaxID=72144 RepID=A0ABR4D2K3_9PEZI